MKQLIFLLLFPAFAMAQYQGNGNQKITLGEQTTADGLVWRGIRADTTSKIVPFSDTSAYIILDTVEKTLWLYKAGQIPKWQQVGGSAGGTTFDTTTLNLVSRFGLKLNISDTSSMLLPYWRSGRFSGVLPIANGGTGQTTLALAGINTGSGWQNYLPKYTATGTTLGNSLIYDNGSTISIGTTTPLAGLLLQLTGANSRIGMLNNSAGNTTNYSQMFFGYGSGGSGEYAEFYRQNNTKRFHVYNDGGDIGLTTRYIASPFSFIYDIYLNTSGNVGIGTTSPTARLHLAAGTASASSAPLKFTSGTNLTTAEAGAMEFNGTNLFFSPSTTRHTVNHGLTGSATLDFPSTGALFAADLTITVTGATDGDVVSLGVPNAAVNANTCYTAWVSAANTVTVRFNNYSSGTVNPASGTFKVFVTK